MPIIKYNLSVVGLPGVGKRSIVFELTGNTEKNLVHRCKLNENYYELQISIYDRVFGNESYIKSSDGVLFIFDKTAPDTFSFISSAYSSLKEYSESKIPPSIIVGNKMDLENEVSQNSISSFQWKHDLKYVETSGYSGKKVEEALKLICTEIDDYKELLKRVQASKKTSYGFGLFDSAVGDTLGLLKSK